MNTTVAMRRRGFTLVELMIALAIASILLVLAAPQYGVWVGDNQVRAGAQSVGDGIRAAMYEAIKRNTQIEFVLDPTTKTGGWIVQLVGGGTLQTGMFAEGADRVTFTPSGGLTTITYTGMGTIQPANADTSLPLERVDVTTSMAGTRALRVLVSVGRTGIKICDPAWPATDPKGCPAVP